MNVRQPEQIVTPQSSPEEPQQPQPNGPPVPERPEETPDPAAPSPIPGPDMMAAPIEQMDFTSQDLGAAEITWTAAEFVEHTKTANWYGALVVAGVAIAVIVYFLTKDKFSTVVVTLVLVGFGLYAARKPQTQNYKIDSYGIQIGSKIYNFHDFKAFSITEDGSVISVILSPLKRFMPPLIIYVAPEVEERVVDFLSAFMPFEQHQGDVVDSLMRKIRF